MTKRRRRTTECQGRKTILVFDKGECQWSDLYHLFIRRVVVMVRQLIYAWLHSTAHTHPPTIVLWGYRSQSIECFSFLKFFRPNPICFRFVWWRQQRTHYDLKTSMMKSALYQIASKSGNLSVNIEWEWGKAKKNRIIRATHVLDCIQRGVLISCLHCNLFPGYIYRWYRIYLKFIAFDYRQHSRTHTFLIKGPLPLPMRS